MPSNLTLRLSAVSHTLVTRNRKVRTQDSRWGKALVVGIVSAALGIFCFGGLWAWSNFQCTSLNYQISEAKETKKQHLELNRKLRVEFSNLTSIARLEKLAEAYHMGPPLPGHVLKVQWP